MTKENIENNKVDVIKRQPPLKKATTLGVVPNISLTGIVISKKKEV